MKLRTLFIGVGWFGLGLLALGQIFGTNQVTRKEAVKIASQLRVGMDELDAMRFLETNGLSVGCTVGGALHGTRFYILSDNSELQLEIDIRPGTFTNRVMKSASILQYGKVTSITLTNRP